MNAALTPDQILNNDFAKNHQGREYTLDQAKQAFANHVARGGSVYQHTHSMFVLKPTTPGTVEFHSINGGTGQHLVQGVNDMLTALKPHAHTAVTHFDNPKVVGLLKHSAHPHTVEQVNGGQDKTYRATFRLRGL